MARGKRGRGILSEADRAYLRGEKQYASEQSERNARARIRDRLFDGVRDFELLVEALSERDRKLVFEKRFADLEGAAGFDALVSWLAFGYLAVGDTDLAFEDVLHEAVNVAEAGENRAATVDLDVTFQSLTAEGCSRNWSWGSRCHSLNWPTSTGATRCAGTSWHAISATTMRPSTTVASSRR